MIYLADNDIVVKLASCDLLDDSLLVLGAARSEVSVLPTLKYRFGLGDNEKARRKRQKSEAQYGTEVVRRLLDFLKDVDEIDTPPSEDLLIFQDLMGIDAGEAILLSVAMRTSSSLVLTGDKRCLETLATHPGCLSIAEGLRGRMVCFEQMIQRLINRFGFNHVRGKVATGLDCDHVLRSAFGSGLQATEINAVPCLDQEILRIRSHPIDLLAP